MIQLPVIKLPLKHQRLLATLQGTIDSKHTFSSQVETAQSLWKTKGGKTGTKAFLEIRSLLLDLCVYVGVCNYCEQNEANDIEHIYPKSFFPKSTFIWENYLLACKQCNTAYKLDKCYVLDAAYDILEVKRGSEPPHANCCFINPKIENPNAFLYLNLQTFKFDLMPGLSKKKRNQAEITLKILELNERDTLIAARKSAAKHFFDQFDRLIKIINVTNIAALEEALSPYDDRFDFTQPLGSIKASIIASYKNYITTYQHPSVWNSIKLIESKTNSKWKEIFSKFPAALTW